MRIIIAIAFFSQWSGNGLVSYYLNKVFDTIGITDPTIQASGSFPLGFSLSAILRLYACFIQLLINGILQIWNLFWALLASTLTDRLGRRFLFLSSVCGMLLFFTLQTIFSSLFAQSGLPGAAHAVIAFIFLFYASYEWVVKATELYIAVSMSIIISYLQHRIHASYRVLHSWNSPLSSSGQGIQHFQLRYLSRTYFQPICQSNCPRPFGMEVLCMSYSAHPLLLGFLTIVEF